jgi:asparagine synthase (glutamine-hydrolysing)
MLKATSSKRKIILKMLAKKILPQGFDMQRKQGFSIPLEHWLKDGPWREFFSDILYNQHSVFDQKSVAGLFKGLDLGRGWLLRY